MAIRINNQNYDGGDSCPYGLIVRCGACRCVDFKRPLFRGTWEKILVYCSGAVILATIFEIAGFWVALTKLIF